MENKELIAQSNRLIQAKYSETLTFWESFIFAKTMSLIQKNDQVFCEYKLFVKEMLDYVEVPATGEAYKLIYEASQKLLERKISFLTYNEEGEKEIVDTYLVTGVTRLAQPKKGQNTYFKLTIHPNLKPYLLQLKQDFSQFQLSDYKALHTHTAIRIYEILVSWYGRGKSKITFEVEELKEMLGLKNKYAHFGGFKKKVLDEAQKRLLESTDYSFTYYIIKQGKVPHSIVFEVNKNKPKIARQKAEPTAPETVEVETVPNEAHEKLFEELQPIVKAWSVSSLVLTKLVETYPEERLRAGIKATKAVEQGGKVENLAGFFVQAVKEGYTTTAETKKKKQAEAKAKAAAEQEKEQAERDQKEQVKKEQYQKEKATFLGLVKENPALIGELLEAGRQGNPIRQTTVSKYDQTQTFEENLATGGVVLATTLQAIAKELYPEKFVK